jgi:hypothetical protein
LIAPHSLLHSTHPSAALRRDIAAEYEFYANLGVDDVVDDYDPSYGSTDYQKSYPEVYGRRGQYEVAGMDGEGRMPYNGGRGNARSSHNSRNSHGNGTRTSFQHQGGHRGSSNGSGQQHKPWHRR